MRRHLARGTLSAAVLVATLGGVARRADAQSPAGSILLEIRPRVGDTIRTRLDQTVEMTGTAHVGMTDSTTAVVSQLAVLSHSVPISADARGTLLESVTDSVSLTTTGGHAAGPNADAARALRGRTMRLRVAADGSTVLDEGTPAGAARDMRALLAQMPATLPGRGVAVGETWSRSMQMPGDDGASGALEAVFRLDSLSSHGDLAYLSLHGTLSRAPERVSGSPGAKVTTTGTLVGAMVVDRRRGWMTSSRTTLVMRSTVAPGAPGAGPMRFRMRVTQWLRAM